MAHREAPNTYARRTGNMYIFNLMIGTGALTLPLAFSQAGLTFGLLTFMLLSFVSFMSASWVIETMATANAILKKERESMSASINSSLIDSTISENVQDNNNHNSNNHLENNDDDDRSLLLSQRHTLKFEITDRVELGKMASLFFNKIGLISFYVVVIIYLYGDLTIYAAAVPKNLRDLLCPYHDQFSISALQNLTNYTVHPDLCWNPDQNPENPENRAILANYLPENFNSRKKIYKLFLILFTIIIGPFTFFNVEKTKLLQIITMIFRVLAFGCMISIAGMRVYHGQGHGDPNVIGNIHGLPMLFGCSIYSFMNHHSLPGLITPIKDKRNLLFDMGLVYLMVFLCYTLLCITAVLCFKHSDLYDMYTLNFINDPIIQNSQWKNLKYFFGLFPVLTLGASFPIIAVTLSNNLKSLFELLLQNYRRGTDNNFSRRNVDIDDQPRLHRIMKLSQNFFLRFAIPLLTIIPPVIVAFSFTDLEKLVAITGSYAGAGIQYVTPACLVVASRKYVADKYGVNWSMRNHHKSPFYKMAWICFALLWCLMCIVFVTIDKKV